MYNFETDMVIGEIKKKKSKMVCIQLPDGLKPYSKEIKDNIEDKTDAIVFIWADTNFGACDIPLHIKDIGFDLIIHFGHNRFGFEDRLKV